MYSSLHPSIRSFIRPFTHLCIHSFIPTSIHPFISSIHSLPLCIHPYIHPSVHSFIPMYSFIHPYIHPSVSFTPSMYPSLPPSLHPSIHSSLCIPPFIHPSLPPSTPFIRPFPPSLCPSIHSSLHPSIHSSFMHPSLPPSLPPSLNSCIHSSIPPSLPPSLHSSIHSSLPPSIHPCIQIYIPPSIPPSHLALGWSDRPDPLVINAFADYNPSNVMWAELAVVSWQKQRLPPIPWPYHPSSVNESLYILDNAPRTTWEGLLYIHDLSHSLTIHVIPQSALPRVGLFTLSIPCPYRSKADIQLIYPSSFKCIDGKDELHDTATCRLSSL